MRALVIMWLGPALRPVTAVGRMPGCRGVTHLARGRLVPRTVGPLHGNRADTGGRRHPEHEHEQSDRAIIPAKAIERDHDGPEDTQSP